MKGVHWKDWCWSWNFNTLATWCEELTHLKRPWCWKRLNAWGEGDDRGWAGWMASLTQWTWVWVNSGSWWWTGRPGVRHFMELQRVGHDWVTELNWTNLTSEAHLPNMDNWISFFGMGWCWLGETPVAFLSVWGKEGLSEHLPVVPGHMNSRITMLLSWSYSILLYTCSQPLSPFSLHPASCPIFFSWVISVERGTRGKKKRT